MCQIIEETIISKVAILQVGLQLRTPDNSVGVPFSIAAINGNVITIDLNSGNQLEIDVSALSVTMLFLVRNGHDLAHPVNIESNNNQNQSGPLCHISRMQNNNVRCINYVLPILASFGFVGISGQRLNSCWYI